MKVRNIRLAFLFISIASIGCSFERELATTATLTNPLAEGQSERRIACDELQASQDAHGCAGASPDRCYPADLLTSAYCSVPAFPDSSEGASAKFCLGAMDLASYTAPFDCRKRAAPFLSCVARTMPDDPAAQDPLTDCAEYWMGPECGFTAVEPSPDYPFHLRQTPSQVPEYTEDSVVLQCRGGVAGFATRTPDDPELRARLRAENKPVFEHDSYEVGLGLCADEIDRMASCELMDDCTWTCSCFEGDTKTLEERVMLMGTGDREKLLEVCGWAHVAPAR